jgi:hypothetical protein
VERFVVTARVAIGVKARERLRRLAVVFAVEIRLTIVSELYMREMSTKRFHEEFGGGSLSRVNKNFKVLEDEIWLRYVRSEGPGGNRRGGVEHFYRATEPAFFDLETWSFMPYSVRVTSSWNMFKRAISRLRGALEVSVSSSSDTRDLSCTRFSLDEKGWKRAIDAVTAHFVRIFDEQEDSRRRAGHSGEELIRTDVFSIAFESSTEHRSPASPSLIENHRDPMASFPERLAPILRDEVSLEIVTELNRREISVTQFHREFGGASKSAIGRRFKALERGGWAGKAGRETGGKRRGATEQFYRATMPAPLDYDPCANPPGPLLGSDGWHAFERLCAQMREAMMTGSFDKRLDRIINWSFVSLDRQGRRNVIGDTERLFQFISEEQAEAGRRMAESGEKPVTMTVGLAVLEASKELTKAP